MTGTTVRPGRLVAAVVAGAALVAGTTGVASAFAGGRTEAPGDTVVRVTG